MHATIWIQAQVRSKWGTNEHSFVCCSQTHHGSKASVTNSFDKSTIANEKDKTTTSRRSIRSESVDDHKSATNQSRNKETTKQRNNLLATTRNRSLRAIVNSFRCAWCVISPADSRPLPYSKYFSGSLHPKAGNLKAPAHGRPTPNANCQARWSAILPVLDNRISRLRHATMRARTRFRPNRPTISILNFAPTFATKWRNVSLFLLFPF